VTEGFALCFALGFALLLSLYTLRHPEPEALILFGVAASSLGGALTALVYNLSPSPLAMAEIMGWMMGSVENRHMGDVLWAALALLAGGVLAAFCAPLLRLLSLGEETAASSALSVRPLKMVAVLCASLCASVAVAVAGMIGFIGLAAPHMVRPFVGQDPARVLAPSALFGAVFVVLADCLVRVIPTEAELKLGVLSALVGAPIFGLLAWRAARSWRS
jgi:iron complex transport system permease protein